MKKSASLVWLAFLAYASAPVYGSEKVVWSGKIIPVIGGEAECVFTADNSFGPAHIRAYNSEFKLLWEIANGSASWNGRSPDGSPSSAASLDCRYFAYMHFHTTSPSRAMWSWNLVDAKMGKILRRFPLEVQHITQINLPGSQGLPWKLYLGPVNAYFRHTILGDKYDHLGDAIIRNSDGEIIWILTRSPAMCEQMNIPEECDEASERFHKLWEDHQVLGSTSAYGARVLSSPNGKYGDFSLLLDPYEFVYDPHKQSYVTAPWKWSHFVAPWDENGINGVGEPRIPVPAQAKLAFSEDSAEFVYLTSTGIAHQLVAQKVDGALLWKKNLEPTAMNPGEHVENPGEVRFAKDKIVVHYGHFVEIYDLQGNSLGRVRIVYPGSEQTAIYFPEGERYIRLDCRKKDGKPLCELIEGHLAEKKKDK